MSWYCKFVSPTGVERKPLGDDTSVPVPVKTAVAALMEAMAPSTLVVETSGHINEHAAYASCKIDVQRVPKSD
jgi:hypothetical protein